MSLESNWDRLKGKPGASVTQYAGTSHHVLKVFSFYPDIHKETGEFRDRCGGIQFAVYKGGM